ncbi:MAG: lactonase family protein [Butyrivibrio sp.]|nr:lactonase family protein [Butyrivibrio sp.]
MAKVSSNDSYVAYVASYTSGSDENYGIRIYDVDVKKGRLTEKEKVKITNSSYISLSHNKKFLYSITDAGVEAYNIEPDGSLRFLNKASINGMRGCYINTDQDDNFLVCAGYHDGKVTILELNKDGSIGKITDEKFHKGLGTIAGRNHVPHVQCIKITKDNKYLLAADLGMDRVNVYKLDTKNGKITDADVIHCDQESSPRHMRFSKDGKFLYVVFEQQCSINVYAYKDNNGIPSFDEVQSIQNSEEYDTIGVASSALKFSDDYEYLVSTVAGENNVIVYKADKETGLLTKKIELPVSGEYPKDAILFPDNKHIVSLNHESNTLTFFNVDFDKGTLVMNGPELPVDRPNCIVIKKLEKA